MMLNNDVTWTGKLGVASNVVNLNQKTKVVYKKVVKPVTGEPFPPVLG